MNMPDSVIIFVELTVMAQMSSLFKFVGVLKAGVGEGSKINFVVNGRLVRCSLLLELFVDDVGFNNVYDNFFHEFGVGCVSIG